MGGWGVRFGASQGAAMLVGFLSMKTAKRLADDVIDVFILLAGLGQDDTDSDR